MWLCMGWNGGEAVSGCVEPFNVYEAIWEGGMGWGIVMLNVTSADIMQVSGPATLPHV